MSFAEHVSPNAIQTLCAQHSPGMKMLLGEDARFEWKKLYDKDASDMVLTVRGNGTASLPIRDARAILEACNGLGMKGFLHGDYSRLGCYKIQGKLDKTQCSTDDKVPQSGMLVTPLDFGEDRIHSVADITHFALKVTAATYKDVIQAQQKSLAIGS